MKNLLARLNPEQRTAVATTEGPLLVLAGAGTGKTSVITARIAYLLQKGAAASSILALTFTNKAAGEMRARIAGAIGPKKAEGLAIGTFHSFCVRTLRMHASALGIPAAFSICDEADQLATVKGAMRELKIPAARLHPRVLVSRISLLKNRLTTSASYLEGAANDEEELIGRTYQSYDACLRRARCLDFDDLLLFMVKLLRECAEVRSKLQRRFRYIMVDEYQDTNAPQYEIVRLIAERHRNLCVVGDDDQSIYGWRGADVKKILGFERDFPGATVVRLETNYRSTDQILEAANRVIRHNADRHEKTLRSVLGPGEEVVVVPLEDEMEEAHYVVRGILEQVRERSAKYGSFAILVRTQAQSRVFEAELRARSVPYVLVGGMSFFDRKEVKDVLAFLRIVANPDDEVSLLRIVNCPPRGVGKTTIDRVLAFATEHSITAPQAFDRAAEIPNLPPAAVNAVQHLRSTLAALGKAEPGKRLVERIKTLLDAVQYRKEVERCHPDRQAREDRWLSVMEVLNFAENYVRRSARPTLRGFLDELTLSANDDKTAEDADERSAVTIMTFHAAKGLEFPRVYLVGLEEGILPHFRSAQEGAVEEERRLMYVGITRAQRALTLSYAKERAKFGVRQATMASRFLFELNGEEPPPDWHAVGEPQRTIPRRTIERAPPKKRRFRSRRKAVGKPF
ncbi:MAG: UvrD-helicase domain-containing protein [Planctomycetota bacterium]